MKKYLIPTLLLAVFEAVAVSLWLGKGNIFYLLNFSYIGISLALGVFLFLRGVPQARRVSQLLVGTYMLGYLGILCRENMQLEGFWYYLFSGSFTAATIHYAVAKIFGPLVFGRGWCGYACWTAMVLDFLPYKTSPGPRKSFGWIRYTVFAASFLFVAALFLLGIQNKEAILFWAFLLGNSLYYAVGIFLAFRLHDNRAFCKYICPITVFLKPMSYFSLFRVKCDHSKCVSCGKCKKICPMEVDVTDNSRRRKNGTVMQKSPTAQGQHGKDPLHAKAPSGDAGRGLGNFGKIKTLPEYRQRIYQPRNQTVRSKGTRKAEIKLLSRPCWNGGIWYKRTHGREFH